MSKMKKDDLKKDLEATRNMFGLVMFNTNSDIENFKINGTNVSTFVNEDGTREFLIMDDGYEKLSEYSINILNIIQEKFTQASKQIKDGLSVISMEEGHIIITNYKSRLIDFSISAEYLCKRLGKANTERNRGVIKGKCSGLATFLMTRGMICNAGKNKEITKNNLKSAIKKSYVKSNIMLEYYNYYIREVDKGGKKKVISKDKKYVTFSFSYRFIKTLFLNNSMSIHITERSLRNTKDKNAYNVQLIQSRYTMRSNVINGNYNVIRIRTLLEGEKIDVENLKDELGFRALKQKISRLVTDILKKIDNKYPTKWEYCGIYKSNEEIINGSVRYTITSLDYLNDIQKRISCQIKNI